MIKNIWALSIRNKIYTIPGLVFVCILMISMLAKGKEVEETEHSYIKRGDVPIKFTEAGEVKSINYMNVIIPRNIKGSLQIIELVDEGEIVKKGDIICRMDPENLLQEISQLKDQVSLAYANLEKTKMTQAAGMNQLNNSIKTGKYSYKIAKLQRELYKFESVSRQEEADINLIKAELSQKEAEDKIEAQKIIDKSELTKIRIKIQEAENDLKKATENLEDLNIKAPNSGLLVYYSRGWPTRVKVRIGDTVHRGQRIMKIPDLENMRAVFKINEIDKAKVEKGLKAEIRLDAFPDLLFHGTVTDVTAIVDWWGNDSNLKLFEAHVNIEETDSRLKPGLTAGIELIAKEYKDVLYAPLSALREYNGKTVIFEPGTSPKPIEVNLIDRSYEFAVIEGDIKENMEIGINGLPGDPLGKSEYITMINNKFDQLQVHFEKINDLGINYDYDGNRGKKREIKQLSPEEEEFQKFKQKMKSTPFGKTMSDEKLKEMFDRFNKMKKGGGRGGKMQINSGRGTVKASPGNKGNVKSMSIKPGQKNTIIKKDSKKAGSKEVKIKEKK